MKGDKLEEYISTRTLLIALESTAIKARHNSNPDTEEYYEYGRLIYTLKKILEGINLESCILISDQHGGDIVSRNINAIINMQNVDEVNKIIDELLGILNSSRGDCKICLRSQCRLRREEFNITGKEFAGWMEVKEV